MAHGTLKPGGVADRHFHDIQYQAMYVLGGLAKISLWVQASQNVGAGSIIRIPPGLTHEVKSMEPDDLELLIVYSPPISR